MQLIKSICEEKKYKAGIRTLKMIILRDHEIVMNLKKIQRIKRVYGLATIVRRKNKYRFISKGGEDHKAAPNLLRRNFDVLKSDLVYSTDITYLNYGLGQRAYLSAIKDLGTKEIVHYTVSKNIGMEIATDGLDNFFEKIKPIIRNDLILHSDQGTHYTNKTFREKLAQYGVNQSMSRKGNCLDNAPIESFFGHLKDEIDLRSCRKFDELEKKVSDYIRFYNHDRPQWGLKRKTPAEYRGLIL